MNFQSALAGVIVDHAYGQIGAAAVAHHVPRQHPGGLASADDQDAPSIVCEMAAFQVLIEGPASSQQPEQQKRVQRQHRPGHFFHAGDEENRQRREQRAHIDRFAYADEIGQGGEAPAAAIQAKDHVAEQLAGNDDRQHDGGGAQEI